MFAFFSMSSSNFSGFSKLLASISRLTAAAETGAKFVPSHFHLGVRAPVMAGFNQGQPWVNFGTPAQHPFQQPFGGTGGTPQWQTPANPFPIGGTPGQAPFQQPFGGGGGFQTQQPPPPSNSFVFPAPQTPFGSGIQAQPPPQQQLFSFGAPAPVQVQPQNPFGFGTPIGQGQQQQPPQQQFWPGVQPQPQQPFGFGNPSPQGLVQQSAFGTPAQQQPFWLANPQQQPFYYPVHGAASPLAIEYLRSIGIQYQPGAFLSPPQPPIQTPPPTPIPHPATIFPSTQRGSGQGETDKFVLVDVEALAKVLKRSCSFDSFPRSHSYKSTYGRNPFEEIRNRLERERNRLDPGPYSSTHGESHQRTPSPAGLHLCRSSLFETRDGLSLECPSAQNRLTSGGGFRESGPPIRNNNSGSRPWTNLLRSQLVPPPIARTYNWNSPAPTLVGYRAPPQTTIIPPRRSRSTELHWERSQGRAGIFEGFLNTSACGGGGRNLSLNLDPYPGQRPETGSLERPLPPNYWSQGPLCGQSPSSNVTLTKMDYYCQPSVGELDRMTKATGRAIVAKFQIGHSVWGKIIYDEPFDVRGLNLDQLVDFGDSFVRVYPPGSTRPPPPGQGLNRPATVVLSRIFPTNPLTKAHVHHPTQVQLFNFTQTLREKTASFGGTFVNYEPDTGDWTFKVPCMVPPSHLRHF